MPKVSPRREWLPEDIASFSPKWSSILLSIDTNDLKGFLQTLQEYPKPHSPHFNNPFCFISSPYHYVEVTQTLNLYNMKLLKSGQTLLLIQCYAVFSMGGTRVYSIPQIGYQVPSWEYLLQNSLSVRYCISETSVLFICLLFSIFELKYRHL